MSERGASRRFSKGGTKIAEARFERSLTQEQVAAFSGIPIASYRRLERGENPNPPLRWLVNLQQVFALDDVRELLEDEWLEFLQLQPSAPQQPPDPEIIRARPRA